MDTAKKLSDQQLVSDYIQGNELALSELLNRYQVKLINFINYLVRDTDLANDIMQEAFFKFIKAVKSNSFRNDGKFFGYLSTISYNLAMDHMRKNKKMPMVSGGVDWCVFSNLKVKEISPVKKMMQGQSKFIIKKMLDELPPKHQEIIEMRFLQNLTFKEIAAKTNTPINTCLSHFRKAILNMKSMIEAKNVKDDIFELA